jgi:hypothetical protein
LNIFRVIVRQPFKPDAFGRSDLRLAPVIRRDHKS